MNDVRKALIYGIENPPREYTIEEWFIITEFARYVAGHSKESLIEDVKEAMKKQKPCVTIDTEDVVYKEPIDTKLIHRINIDNIKSIDCEDGTVYADNEKGLPRYERPIHIDNVRPIKDDRVAEVRIEFKCDDCKYREREANEYPCNECEKSSKFEKRKTK